MLNRIRTEPVVVTALIQAAIVLAVSFGLDVSNAQTAAILGFTGAVLALVARGRVTPTVKIGGQVAPADERGIVTLGSVLTFLLALFLLLAILYLLGVSVRVG